MRRRKISAINVAFLYVGTLMGAGFASGREIWQFFGVFGEKSYQAILMVTILFILFGMMTVKISTMIDTADIGKIIMPYENPHIENLIGNIIAAILFLVYIVMAAAGGALFQEQFGFHRAIGGAVLMLLIILTTLGGFERIAKSFSSIVPVLLIIVFAVCISIIIMEFPVPGRDVTVKISPLAPYWHSSAIIYISYNMLAGIPIMARSTIRAKSTRSALIGAALGGLILGLAALVMNAAMLTDAGLSADSVLPILALSGKLSETVRWIYAILLLFAVYSTATSNFYGFTTRIKEGANRKLIIIAAAFAGFSLSLFGFAEIIAFLLPLEGYCGILFLSFMTVNYFRIRKQKKTVAANDGKLAADDAAGEPSTEISRSMKEKDDNMGIHNNMENIELQSEKDKRFRFPGGIVRVTAGHGGEALLVSGSEKTALVDCGMAYCGEALAENIKRELGDRTLDYVILTHTHYDHIGGLPYLRKVWPKLVSFGAAYGKKVLEKDSALKQIGIMSRAAWKQYTGIETKPDVLMEGMKIDRTVCEEDIISLGGKELHIFETPGHTNCSLTILLEPEKIIFPSETIGVYTGMGTMAVGMLKSCGETMESIEKCRRINAEHIISPHYGLVPEYDKKEYWNIALETLYKHKNFVLERVKRGVSFEKIMEEYTDEFYISLARTEQPKEAFLLNAQHMVHNLIKEFQE